MRFTLKKSEILRGKKNFEHLVRNSKKFEGTFLRCYVTLKPREGNQSNKQVVVAFSVNKKLLPKAVDRNRIRRLMRESYRLNKSILLLQNQESTKQIQILFVYTLPRKQETVLPSFVSIQDDIKKLLETISMSKLERD
ncbi:MAG: ribonuclease P protein component [Ignavibacteriales bacterium]|nr:ribonuclease P protein component [Ignavibacteriales bacterium]